MLRETPTPPSGEQPSGSGAVGNSIERVAHWVHAYDEVRRIAGGALLSTIQAFYHRLHEPLVSFWTAFVFTFPLTAAIAVSVWLWRLIGVDATTRGMARVFLWCIGFSILVGIFTGVGEDFAHRSVGAGDYALTLQQMGGNAPSAQLRESLATVSKIRGFGSAFAALVESAYVYGLGNFVFSLIVGLLLGWLSLAAIERLFSSS